MTQKRPFAKIKHELNPDFDKLVNDAEYGRLPRHMSAFMTRPAYAYTNLQQKRIFKQDPCERCGYFYKTEEMPKEDCTFPWLDPDEAAESVYPYLPCQEGKDEDE